MKTVTIYTDGACSGNPGIGGWGAILTYNGKEKVISGYDKETTNNRMEVYAIIAALRCLKEPCHCLVYSDSAYVTEAFNQGWLDNWQRNNWRTAGKQAVKNVDLWQALLIEITKHKVEFIKVKGHANVELNERCDQLAREAIDNCRLFNKM